MKMRIIKQLIDAKEKLIESKKSLDNAISESKKLAKENRQLLSKIESAEKRGGVLLLNDIDTGLIEKLQELTSDDNVIVIFTPDGSRIEIKHKDTNYSNKPGMVRQEKKKKKTVMNNASKLAKLHIVIRQNQTQ